MKRYFVSYNGRLKNGTGFCGNQFTTCNMKTKSGIDQFIEFKAQTMLEEDMETDWIVVTFFEKVKVSLANTWMKDRLKKLVEKNMLFTEVSKDK